MKYTPSLYSIMDKVFVLQILYIEIIFMKYSRSQHYLPSLTSHHHAPYASSFSVNNQQPPPSILVDGKDSSHIFQNWY